MSRRLFDMAKSLSGELPTSSALYKFLLALGLESSKSEFVKSASAVLATDYSNNTDTFTDVVSVTLDTDGTTKLIVDASFASRITANEGASFRVTVDGVAGPGSGTKNADAVDFAAAIAFETDVLASGTHTVALQASGYDSGGGSSTVVIQPGTNPGFDSASLVVSEVGA